MSKESFQKGVGAALIVSGLILLVLKLVSLPEARQVEDSWAQPESGTHWFLAGLAIEFVFLVSRFLLGYFTYIGRNSLPWVFYPLVLLVAVSGLSGLVLALVVLVLRFWQGKHSAIKT